MERLSAQPKKEMSVEVFFLSKQWATCCLNSVGGFIVLSVSDLIAIQCRFCASVWNPGPCPWGKKGVRNRFLEFKLTFVFATALAGLSLMIRETLEASDHLLPMA